ncbi:MAG: CoA pyrophosphatase [Rhodospirillaceae bacterium]
MSPTDLASRLTHILKQASGRGHGSDLQAALRIAHEEGLGEDMADSLRRTAAGYARKRNGTRPAAVLVPLVAHPDGLTVLLTQRTAHLRNHGGQVSFPGGRLEEEDDGPETAALREAEEEINLPPDAVTVVGRLDDYVTITGFLVTPVVGLVDPASLGVLEPDPSEVDDFFEVPLDFILDPAHHRREVKHYKDEVRTYFAIPFQERHIWGATAAMLMNLFEVLKPWSGPEDWPSASLDQPRSEIERGA